MRRLQAAMQADEHEARLATLDLSIISLLWGSRSSVVPTVCWTALDRFLILGIRRRRMAQKPLRFSDAPSLRHAGHIERASTHRTNRHRMNYL